MDHRSARNTFSVTPEAVEAFISSSCKLASTQSWIVNADYKRELLQAKPQAKQASLTSFFKPPPAAKAPTVAPASPTKSAASQAQQQQQQQQQQQHSPVKRKAEADVLVVSTDEPVEPSGSEAKVRKVASEEVLVVDDEPPAVVAVTPAPAAASAPVAAAAGVAQKRITDIFTRVFVHSGGSCMTDSRCSDADGVRREFTLPPQPSKPFMPAKKLHKLSEQARKKEDRETVPACVVMLHSDSAQARAKARAEREQKREEARLKKRTDGDRDAGPALPDDDTIDQPFAASRDSTAAERS